MALPLKGRSDAQIRAAHSAVTRAQIYGDETIRYELETEIPKLLAKRKPPVNLSKKVLHFNNMRKGFRNYTHNIGVAIWETDPDNLDILTEDKKLSEWINKNPVIQTTLAGFEKAQELRWGIVAMIKAGKTKDMSEEYIRALIKTISDCVPEPPPETVYCHCGRD